MYNPNLLLKIIASRCYLSKNIYIWSIDIVTNLSVKVIFLLDDINVEGI